MEIKITISDSMGATAAQLAVSGAAAVADRLPSAAAIAALAQATLPGIDAGSAPFALAASGSHRADAASSTDSALLPGQTQNLSAGAAPTF